MKTVFGLRSQFILLAFFCIAGTISVTSYFIIERERRLLEEKTIQQALMLGASSSVLFTNAFVYEELGLFDKSALEEYLDFYVKDIMALDDRVLSFMALDTNSRIVTHSDFRRYGDIYQLEHFKEAIEGKTVQIRPLAQGENALEVLVPLAIESKKWGLCRIVFSTAEIAQATEALRLEVFGIASVNLLLSLLIIGFAAEYFIHPLKKLSAAMGKITVEGDVSSTLPRLSERRDEIGQLQQSFHWMTSRLKEEEKARLQTREQLFHAEKMATVGALTASIAHEINNPLGGVILCFNNLCNEDLDDEARRQHIEVIQQSLERMQKTMRDLLDYSRQSTLTTEPVAPAAIVEKSLALVETMLRQKRIEHRLFLDEGLTAVVVDIGKIQQVVVNLIVNAAQAMATGGRLHIDIGLRNQFVVITVSDTGPGIAKVLQEKIFEPFFTTKEVGQGTGLGLALSRSIAEQHGGTLTLVESDERGSRFALLLPCQGGVDAE
ncbi:MAG: sensor histidine kinase [Desulfopila sp.]